MASDLDLTFNNPNGFLTTTFVATPQLPKEYGVTVSIRSDNRIIMGGYEEVTQILLACFNTDGTFYTTFGGGTGKVMQPPPSGKTLVSVDDVALLSNDSIIVTGTVMNLASKNEMFVAKFDSLGILDLSFGPSGNGFVITTYTDFNVPGFAFDECNSQSCVILPNGSIVIAGSVRRTLVSPNKFYLALVRYDASGSPDPSFGTNPNGSGTVFKLFTPLAAENEIANALVLQTDGKLVIVGSRFGVILNESIVARFNTNGSVDTTFGTLGVFTIPPFFTNSSGLDAIKIDSNGRIIVGGIVTNAIGQGYFALACVTPNGTLNPLFGTSGLVTFGLPPTYNIIGPLVSTGVYGNRVALQTDDKIVITGGFENTITTTANGISLARFNTDGTLDTTFGVAGVGYIFSDLITPPPPPPFPSPNVEAGWSVAIQSNGKILVGGTAILIDDTYGNSYWILARYIYTPEPPVPIIPICFPAGTPVLTDQGNVFIEKIEPGKNTIRGKEIVAVTKTRSPFNKLVCFERGTLGRHVPNKRTLVSFEHCIVYRNKLIPAFKFVNKIRGIYYVNYTNQYLYNVLLKHHFYMMVNNMMVETLNPTNIMAKLVTSNANENEKTKLICKINEHAKLTMKKMKEDSVTTLNEMNKHYTINNHQIYKIHAYHPSFNKFIHTRRIHELQRVANYTRNAQHSAMKHGAKRVHLFSVRRRMR